MSRTVLILAALTDIVKNTIKTAFWGKKPNKYIYIFFF